MTTTQTDNLPGQFNGYNKPDLENVTVADYPALIAEINLVIQQIHSANLPLPEAIQLYSRGNLLIQTCQRLIQQADQQVWQTASVSEPDSRVGISTVLVPFNSLNQLAGEAKQP